MVNYFNAWKRSFNFSSKTSRREFWDFNLIDYLLFVVLWIPQLILGPIYSDVFMQVPDSTFVMDAEIRNKIFLIAFTFGSLQLVWLFTGVIPRISIRIRRLRDIGKSWKWIFLWIIPFVGLGIEIAWFRRPSIKNKSLDNFINSHN